MKRTLLDLTQTLAASLGSDEINSITDSVESQDIVKLIKTVYEEIWERADLPEHYGVVNLEASGTASRPVLMTVPSNVSKLLWVKYNTETADDTDDAYQPVTYLPFSEFSERMHALVESDDNVGSFTYTLDGYSFTAMYKTDVAPTYYTTLDDNVLLFDSYDSELDATLQSAKTYCYAKFEMPWTNSDTFIPDLDSSQFNLLLNEAKSLAWFELKQTPNQKAEQSARRGWVRMQRSKDRAVVRTPLDEVPNYGRGR